MSIQLLKEADDAIGTLRAKLAEVREDELRRLVQDPMPKKFVGSVRDYRYRSGDYLKGELPKHTMRIVVDESLVLWMSTTTDVFERNILSKMKFKGFEAMSKKLNGKLLMVERIDSRLVPVSLMPDPLKLNDIVLTDIYGRPMWEGAPVIVLNLEKGERQGTVTGVVAGTEGILASINLPDRDSPINKYSRNLVRAI